MIGTGSMSDPYMHCEEKLQHMRKCLELIEQYGFGVALQTKSDLCKIIEPNVCTTKRRAEVLNIIYVFIVQQSMALCNCFLPIFYAFLHVYNLRSYHNSCIPYKQRHKKTSAAFFRQQTQTYYINPAVVFH